MYHKTEKFQQYTQDLLFQLSKGLLTLIKVNWNLVNIDRSREYDELISLALSQNYDITFTWDRDNIIAWTNKDERRQFFFQLSTQAWLEYYVRELLLTFSQVDVFVDENGANIYSRVRYPFLLSRLRLDQLRILCERSKLSLPTKQTRQTLSRLLLFEKND